MARPGKTPDLASYDGFKLHRRTQNIILPPKARVDFRKFSQHMIYPDANMAAEVLTGDEVRQILSQSPTLSSMDKKELIRQLISMGSYSALFVLTLPADNLSYGSPDQSGNTPLNLYLEDKQGYLAEERATYLEVMAELGQVALSELPEFLPAVEIGKAIGGEELPPETLEFLASLLPTQVKIEPVDSFPPLNDPKRPSSAEAHDQE